MIVYRSYWDPTHWWTPAGQILGSPDPCDPCGFDAYVLMSSGCFSVVCRVCSILLQRYGLNNVRSCYETHDPLRLFEVVAPTIRRRARRISRHVIGLSNHIISCRIVVLKRQNRLKTGTDKPKLKVKMQSVSVDELMMSENDFLNSLVLSWRRK